MGNQINTDDNRYVNSYTHEANNNTEDDELMNIFVSNKLNKDLYQILHINGVDLDTLKHSVKDDEMNNYCRRLKIKGLKKAHFRKLMRKINELKKEEQTPLQQFFTKNKLPQTLYNILVKENVRFKHLKELTPTDIDNLCDNINIDDKHRFKKAIENLENENNTKHKHIKQEEKKTDSIMRMLVVGDKGVGKTSLIHRYINNTYNNNNTLQNIAKYDHKERVSDGSMIDIQIMDSLDIKQYSYDVIIICYDKKDMNSFRNCINWRKQIVDNNMEDVIVLVVACKADEGYLNRQTEEQKMQSIINDDEWKQLNVLSLECSARTGVNVKNIFITASEMVLNKTGYNNKNDVLFGKISTMWDVAETLWTSNLYHTYKTKARKKQISYNEESYNDESFICKHCSIENNKIDSYFCKMCKRPLDASNEIEGNSTPNNQHLIIPDYC